MKGGNRMSEAIMRYLLLPSVVWRYPARSFAALRRRAGYRRRNVGWTGRRANSATV